MVKRIVIAYVLFFIWIACAWTLFRPGFFRIHDYVHGARVGEMALALADGHFPVRWSQNFGYGYGMPLFEFYAPLPYYIGAFLFWLGVNLVLVLKFLFGIVSVITLLGAYYLGKELVGRMGGVMLAALLTLAPYRAVNLYVRGALSEVWGLMALPWVLYGIILVLRQRRGGWLIVTLGLVVLMLSHNLTTLMFVPLSLVFAAGFGIAEVLERRTSWKALFVSGLKIATAYALAIGLAAFYMVPAMLEKGFTKVETIVGGYFDYHLHFLYIRQFLKPGWSYGGSGWGPDDGISFFLGWGQWLAIGLLAMAALSWLVRYLRSRKGDAVIFPKATFFRLGVALVLAGISFFMAIGKSQYFWDQSELLAFVQFPWRWINVGIVFLSLASCYSLLLVRRRWHRILIVVLVVTVTWVGNISKFQPSGYLDEASSLYYTDPERIRLGMSNVLEDYIPIQMSNTLEEEAPPEFPLVINQTQPAQVVLDRVHEKLLRTNFTKPERIELAIADFPGWYAQLDGEEMAIGHGSYGTITLDIPTGEHLVGVKFGYTRVRLISDVVSAASFLILLFIVLPGVKGHEKIKSDD